MKISKMGIFNNIGRFTEFNVDQYIKNFNIQIQTGFKLTPDNNYDMENRKLTNVQNGDAENDVMVKRQPFWRCSCQCLVSERSKWPRGAFFQREPR